MTSKNERAIKRGGGKVTTACKEACVFVTVFMFRVLSQLYVYLLSISLSLHLLKSGANERKKMRETKREEGYTEEKSLFEFKNREKEKNAKYSKYAKLF